MTDQNSQFFAILTAVGEAKQANASALGVPWTFAQMGVGDANLTDPVPSRIQTRLLNERRRAPLNQVKVDPANANIIIAEQVIPPDVGGWWIREIGLYDAAGDLVAVANCAPSFKPLLSQGTGKTQVVRLNLLVTSTANVQLKIDPAVVLATREYVDSSILNVLPRNKASGVYTMVEVSDRGIVQRGYKPTTLAEYGITDAMPKGAGGLMTTPLMVFGHIAALAGTQFVAVNQGTADRPPTLDNGVGLHIKHPDGNFSLEIVGSVTTPYLGYRRVNENGDGQWHEIWHSGNFDAKNTMPRHAGGLLTAPEKIVGPIAALTGTQFISVGPETTDKPALIDHGAGFHIKYPDSNYSVEFVAGVNTEWLGYRRVDNSGFGTWCEVWTTKNFDPATKADRATTLAGYSIPVATQGDAESGNDNSKPMTALRVAQAIGKFAGLATDAFAGVLRIATQAEVDSGFAPAAVTPARLRLGFTYLFGRSGYLVLPTWLGGWVVQWQQTPVAATTDVIVMFPIQYPREVFGVLIGCDYTPGSGVLNYHAAGLVDNSRFAMRSSANAAASAWAISVGC